MNFPHHKQPDSPPDFMDLINPQFTPSTSVMPPGPSGGAASSSALGSSGTVGEKVVLEQRFPPAEKLAPLSTPQQNSSATPSPEKPKLTAAEIQRMRINAASEYYRKLREEANNSSDSRTNSDSSGNLGPPPPLIPNNNQISPPKGRSQQPQHSAITTTPIVSPISGTSHQIVVQQQPTQVVNKPNIDLGEVVRSTIINGVTKSFSQVIKEMNHFAFQKFNFFDKY